MAASKSDDWLMLQRRLWRWIMVALLGGVERDWRIASHTCSVEDRFCKAEDNW